MEVKRLSVFCGYLLSYLSILAQPADSVYNDSIASDITGALMERIKSLESTELVESMSQRSLLTPFYQPELKALIAKQAFDFWITSSVEKYASHLKVYSALYYANKYLDYDNYNQKAFNQVIGHDESVVSIKFSSDPNIFYSAGSDGKVLKWDLNDLTTIPTVMYTGKHLIKSIDVSDDGTLLLIVAKDVGVVLVDMNNIPREGPNAVVDKEFSQSAIFLPGENKYLTVNRKGELKVKGIAFDSVGIGSSDQKVLSLAIKADDQTIFAGTDKGDVKIWDKINQTNHYFDESYAINALAISNDNNLLAIGREKGDAILWDIERKEVVRVISGHQSAVTDVDFSPDNKYLLTASRDRTARLWDLTNTRKLPTIFDDHNDWVLTAKFDVTGEQIITGSKDNFLRVWPMDPKILADRICDFVDRNLTREEWAEYVGDKFPYQETCIQVK